MRPLYLVSFRTTRVRDASRVLDIACLGKSPCGNPRGRWGNMEFVLSICTLVIICLPRGIISF